MDRKRIFAVLGGDARQISVVARLVATGDEVRVFGLPAERLGIGGCLFEDWRAAVTDADVIVLPLPASPDGRRISCPLSPDLSPILFSELLEQTSQDAIILGGRFSPSAKAMAEEQGKTLIDYCKSEEFLLKNAIPTAEGAIFLLMERMPCTVRGMSVAVTGYGRIARALCSLLLAMGAEVTVAARKKSALLEAARHGCRTQPLLDEESVVALCKGKQAVFNTVPYWLFGKKALLAFPRDALLIDLASAPGGVDGEAARALGIPVIWALSLPGKYAPASAGEIIADTVLSMLGKEDML